MNILQYGPTLLTKKVATKLDLNKLVTCVPKLPDPSEVIDGTVMQLTSSQKGYTTTHFYKAVNGKWKDITSAYGPDDNLSITDASFRYEVEGNYYTGYIVFEWEQAGDNQIAGELSHEIVVRKLDSYPAHPGDGQVIVRSVKNTSGQHEYKYFDDMMDEQTMSRYKYSVFHVYATGWWSVTNIGI